MSVLCLAPCFVYWIGRSMFWGDDQVSTKEHDHVKLFVLSVASLLRVMRGFTRYQDWSFFAEMEVCAYVGLFWDILGQGCPTLF